MSNGVDAERCEGIEDRLDYGRWRGDAAGLARILDSEGLIVVDWWRSVTSAGGESKARGTA